LTSTVQGMRGDDPALKRLEPFHTRALASLRQGNRRGYQLNMALARLAFAARFAARHPFVAARSSVARIAERRRLSHSQQCGFVLPAYADTDEQRSAASQALDWLVASNFIRGWTASDAHLHGVTAPERKIMEQGGIALKWTPLVDDAVLDLRGASVDDARATIAELLIARHDVLWRRAAR
jgi:hypothetical protein